MASSDKQSSKKPGSADSVPENAPAGTEAAVKGGSKPAQQQADRDWNNSPKEDGE